MFKSLASIGLLASLLVLSGCVIRMQPPQYGMQVIQQTKVLGSKLSVPSTTPQGGGALEFFFGYVTSTTMFIPVVSNVDTNGVVSSNQVSIAAAPLITMFGVSDAAGVGGVKITDTIISGIQSSNVPVLPLYNLSTKLRPQ